jgi:hypothetical protein
MVKNFTYGLVTCGLLVVSACRTRKFDSLTQTQSANFQDLPADEDAVRPTPEQRLALLGRAHTYLPYASDARGNRTVLEGPKQFQFKNGELDREKSREFNFNQLVECEYLPPWLDNKPGGKTPKFFCQYKYEKDGQIKVKKLKVKYDNDSSPNLFKDASQCITTVNEWATGVEIEERVTEPARRALVQKLQGLAERDGDLTDLFRSARLHLKEKHKINQPFPALASMPQDPGGFLGGTDEANLVENWKPSFRNKVSILAAMRCPES